MSVIRIVHNKENPFVQLNKAALWDERLSLKAVGLWARCMSRPDNWRFNIKELANKCLEGRRAIDGAIHELIKVGYAIRLEHWEKAENGKFKTGGVEYAFFEFPATQEDKDAVLEEFKKSFRHCSFGNCRNGDRRNSNLLRNNIPSASSEPLSETKKEKEEKKEGPGPQAPVEAASPFLANAKSLSDFFLNKIRERNPQFKEPNLKKWTEEFDRLLRIDNRCFEETRELIQWASTHKWWKVSCLSPEKLRKSFDEMVIQKAGDSEKELIRRNRSYAVQLKEDHPIEMKGMTFDDKYAIHRSTAKEVPFNLPEETFREALVSMFGGNYA